MGNGTRHICVITAGHISSCPRMMKAADAFYEAGYNVSILCSSHASWLASGDESFLKTAQWISSVAYFDREKHPVSYYLTGARYRWARQRFRWRGVAQASLRALGAGFTRPFAELVRLGVAIPADLYYAGTSGGIAVAAEIAKQTNTPYALDLEDYHSAEQDASDHAELSHRVIEEIEKRVLAGAKFLTCGSRAIAQLYKAKYGVAAKPIHNVFPLPNVEPDFDITPGSLRLVWLSQTVGAGRGIEDAILALGLADIPCELVLRGKAVEGYLEKLAVLARIKAPVLRIRHEEPEMGQSVVDLCRGYDVGLALEQVHVLNRSVCLCNKPFTYMLAGLAVAFTDTEGQRSLANDLGCGALLFKVGDIKKLADGLRHWANSPEDLRAAKRAAWQAAVRRWHWEHPQERGQLLELVGCAL